MNEEKLLEKLEACEDEYQNVFDELPNDLNWYEYQQILRPYRLKLSEASRNYRLIQTPKFLNDIPEYGDVMKLEYFIDCVKCGGFINSDGFGRYVKDGKESNIEIHPSDVSNNAIRTDFTEIVWFNK